MRALQLPAPERDALLAHPLHVMVRDFPETLAVLRVAGIDLRAHGGRALSRVEGVEALLA